MLGRSCAGQMFTQHKNMAFKELHYHLYTARVLRTVALSAGSIQESCHLHPAAGGRSGYPKLVVTGKKINKNGHRRCNYKQNKM